MDVALDGRGAPLFHVNAFRWPTVRLLRGGVRSVGASRSAADAQVDVAGR